MPAKAYDQRICYALGRPQCTLRTRRYDAWAQFGGGHGGRVPQTFSDGVS